MQSTIFKQNRTIGASLHSAFHGGAAVCAPLHRGCRRGRRVLPLRGDFNDQQINFYQYANAFVKNGGSFSWATDLGSGFVNSYSFYLLGSPFFWLSMVVPARLMPWAMVPLLCLKMAVAGGGGYLWARRWVRDETWSMLAGCLYAFSGFSIYNIFFNHFLDVVALFPYMLAALDDAVIDDKKGAFPFWVALNLVDNYFFFAGQAVFLIIYFFCMAAGRRYELGLRKFVRLAWRQLWAVPAGACCCSRRDCRCCKIRVPSTRSAGTGICSTANPSSTARFLQHPAHARRALFQGPVSGGHPQAHEPDGLSPSGRCRGRAGVLPRKERHPFTYVLKVCVACAFVPVLNSAFYALNSSYYARWYYMPILVLCGATCYLLSARRWPSSVCRGHCG